MMDTLQINYFSPLVMPKYQPPPSSTLPSRFAPCQSKTDQPSVIKKEHSSSSRPHVTPFNLSFPTEHSLLTQPATERLALGPSFGVGHDTSLYPTASRSFPAGERTSTWLDVTQEYGHKDGQDTYDYDCDPLLYPGHQIALSSPKEQPQLSIQLQSYQLPSHHFTPWQEPYNPSTRSHSEAHLHTSTPPFQLYQPAVAQLQPEMYYTPRSEWSSYVQPDEPYLSQLPPRPTGQEEESGHAKRKVAGDNEEKRKMRGRKDQLRPHECRVCAKTFSRPSSLNTHMSVHTGARPFACLRPGCGRRFSVLSNLRRHERNHDSHAAREREGQVQAQARAQIHVDYTDQTRSHTLRQTYTPDYLPQSQDQTPIDYPEYPQLNYYQPHQSHLHTHPQAYDLQASHQYQHLTPPTQSQSQYEYSAPSPSGSGSVSMSSSSASAAASSGFQVEPSYIHPEPFVSGTPGHSAINANLGFSDTRIGSTHAFDGHSVPSAFPDLARYHLSRPRGMVQGQI